jgi:hypothetical protein
MRAGGASEWIPGDHPLAGASGSYKREQTIREALERFTPGWHMSAQAEVAGYASKHWSLTLSASWCSADRLQRPLETRPFRPILTAFRPLFGAP